MNGSILVPSADLATLSRELILIGAGVLILLLDAFIPSSRRVAHLLALAGVVVAALIPTSVVPPSTSFANLLVNDGLTTLLSLVVLLVTFLAILASQAYLRRERLWPAEYYTLLLWCAAGTMLMMRATDLLLVFVALETFSICLYALAGYNRKNPLSTESAIKYFLMGALASAFILYGIAILYGESGSTRFDEIALGIHYAGGLTPAAVLGLVLLIGGFCFKLSIVPFHAWAPDAYQGAPSPFVAFFSVAPKVASIVVLVRVLEIGLYLEDGARWQSLMGVLAALSMVFGTFVALAQRDIKRMLAYSGIVHMGYLLIPLAGWHPGAWRTVVVYLLAYALMNGGAFAMIAALYARADKPHNIDELAGWGYRFPGISVALAICMLSLGGIPPTLGFEAKYLVFVEAFRAGNLWLALLGVFTSLVGIFYYLRVVYVLFMKTETTEPQVRMDNGTRLAALIAAGAVLALGMFPSWIFEAIERLVYS